MVDALVLLVVGAIVVAGPFAFLWFGPWRRRLMHVLAIVWAVLTFPPYALLILVPDTAFAVNWAQCGGRPPVIASNFAAGDFYELPGDYEYGPSIFASAYYCSAAEAEHAGYHRGIRP